jgi:hypothetical protein
MKSLMNFGVTEDWFLYFTIQSQFELKEKSFLIEGDGPAQCYSETRLF